MNRTQRRALAATQRTPTPAYGRPADLFRALAPLGVTINVVRGHGTFRMDYVMPASRELEVRAILSSFPSGEAWSADAIAVLSIVTGHIFDDMPRGSMLHLCLEDVLANPVDSPSVQKLLAAGTRH